MLPKINISYYEDTEYNKLNFSLLNLSPFIIQKYNNEYNVIINENFKLITSINNLNALNNNEYITKYHLDNNILQIENNKANKVNWAVVNNFASLWSNGDLLDSGKTAVDFEMADPTIIKQNDVIDNLISVDINKPLSANQGKQLKNEIDTKQDILISSTNVKTINNNSLLGSGNIDIVWGNSSSIGDYKQSAQSTDHNGWLLCNGSAVDRTIYNNLYNIIGTWFGIGNGSTTFN